MPLSPVVFVQDQRRSVEAISREHDPCHLYQSSTCAADETRGVQYLCTPVPATSTAGGGLCPLDPPRLRGGRWSTCSRSSNQLFQSILKALRCTSPSGGSRNDREPPRPGAGRFNRSACKLTSYHFQVCLSVLARPRPVTTSTLLVCAVIRNAGLKILNMLE
jgi:hypothetical protein